MTHSTGNPLEWRSVDSMSRATALAMFMVVASSDSRTPSRRPSMVGRMPIFGMSPMRRFLGRVIFMAC